MMEKPIWWDYAEFYPDEDEEGFDGVHYGGVKGLKSNTPDRIKKEYEKYLEEEAERKKRGIKI